MAGKIFINYRRGDDPGFAQALFGRLEQVFSPEQLFMDVDNMEPGLDFVKELEEQVAKCDVLISVIGKGWSDARDEAGDRRLDDPTDFVRIEIESALDQDKRVIPVLVGQATMPKPDQLPEKMKPLARRHAVRLTHERFKADTEALIAALERALENAEEVRISQRETDSEVTRQLEEEMRQKVVEGEELRRQIESSQRFERRLQEVPHAKAGQEHKRKKGMFSSWRGWLILVAILAAVAAVAAWLVL